MVVVDRLGEAHTLVTQLELPRLVVLSKRPSMLSILRLVLREGQLLKVLQLGGHRLSRVQMRAIQYGVVSLRV